MAGPETQQPKTEKIKSDKNAAGEEQAENQQETNASAAKSAVEGAKRVAVPITLEESKEIHFITPEEHFENVKKRYEESTRNHGIVEVGEKAAGGEPEENSKEMAALERVYDQLSSKGLLDENDFKNVLSMINNGEPEKATEYLASIRKFNSKKNKLKELIESGALPADYMVRIEQMSKPNADKTMDKIIAKYIKSHAEAVSELADINDETMDPLAGLPIT